MPNRSNKPIFNEEIFRPNPVQLKKTLQFLKNSIANRNNQHARCVAYVPRQIWSHLLVQLEYFLFSVQLEVVLNELDVCVVSNLQQKVIF